MKVTELNFPIRSKFLRPCEDAIRAHRGDLLTGETITINFEESGGITRRGIATIEQDNPHSFWVDKRCDPTWFSARIRAAAYALHRQGFYGEFEIAHDNGLLTIRRV